MDDWGSTRTEYGVNCRACGALERAAVRSMAAFHAHLETGGWNKSDGYWRCPEHSSPPKPYKCPDPRCDAVTPRGHIISCRGGHMSKSSNVIATGAGWSCSDCGTDDNSILGHAPGCPRMKR